MRRPWSAGPAAGLLLALVTVPVLADEPVRGNMLVPVQQVAPGGTFPITGYGMDPGVVVSFVLNQGTASTAAREVVTVDPDGTFATTGLVPADFDPGYAELVATSSEGGQWVASVLIARPGDGLPSAAPDPPTAAARNVDERVLAVIVMAVGLALFAIGAVRYLRR